MNISHEGIEMINPFETHWALASAGTMDDFNGCTIGWGSFGTLWNQSVMTIYIHPGRHTINVLNENDTFTVSFFKDEYKPALSYMGSHSGKNEDKIKNAGLTLVETEDGIFYKEASVTVICKKLYSSMFDKNGLIEDIQKSYIDHPTVYPVNENGEWEPHYEFVGKILKVIENQKKGCLSESPQKHISQIKKIYL